MNIHGKKVKLRAPEVNDIILINKWSNDPEIWSLLAGWHFPFSKRSTEEWIKNRNDNSMNGHVFCIDAKDAGLIGTINLIDIDWKNKNAMTGMVIGDENYRGKGYALDALFALMRYAFMELGLNRLDAYMISYNKRSIRFYINKCGWVEEGRKEEWFFKNGSFHDKVIVGITKKQYLKKVKENNYWVV